MFENNEWFKIAGKEGPFGCDYLNEFDVEQKRTDVELNSLRHILLLQTKKMGHKLKILDLASGTGRIGNPLASLSDTFMVSADLHSHALSEHKNKKITHPVQADMRKLPLNDNTFEVILLLYTSFGYFNDRDNFRVIMEMKRCLADQGKIIIDMPNSEHLQDHFKSNRTKEVLNSDGKLDHVVIYNNILEKKEGDLQETLPEKSLFLRQERTARYNDGTEKPLEPIILRIYNLSQIKILVEKSGLKIEDVTDMDLKKFDPDHSRRMWIHATK